MTKKQIKDYLKRCKKISDADDRAYAAVKEIEKRTSDFDETFIFDQGDYHFNLYGWSGGGLVTHHDSEDRWFEFDNRREVEEFIEFLKFAFL